VGQDFRPQRGTGLARRKDRAEDRWDNPAQGREHIVNLIWFTRNRFFPLREGSTWREGTAINRKAAIERDIRAKLGDVPMGQIDRFLLQMHSESRGSVLNAKNLVRFGTWVFEAACK